jgi:hypothetical protein
VVTLAWVIGGLTGRVAVAQPPSTAIDTMAARHDPYLRFMISPAS